jgi:hypothetical protein
MVFFWLLLNDQLNTRNLLHRKCFNIPSTNCVLSSNDLEETQKHLFFEYDSRSRAGPHSILFGIYHCQWWT